MKSHIACLVLVLVSNVSYSAPPSHASGGAGGRGRPVAESPSFSAPTNEVQRQTDAFIAKVEAARKKAKQASNSFAAARGALAGISTTQIFGKKPNGFQLGLANGLTAKANGEFKELNKMLKELKKDAEAYDQYVKEMSPTDINKTLFAEFTVVGLWGYKEDHHYALFNLAKVIEVERADAQVTKTDKELASLEEKLRDIRRKSK